MAMSERRLETLRHAYRIIGVPLSASTSTIKRTYRDLIRRWHPDRYARTISSSQADATEMTKLINQAYAEIEHAPLRYYSGQALPLQDRLQNAGSVNDHSSDDVRLATDRLEFCVRFVCGCLLGCFVSVRLFLYVFDQMTIFTAVAVSVLALGCGFGTTRWGDGFWRSLLRYWWLWS
jgi:hypothetical protein